MKPTLFFPALLLLSPFSAAETPVNELLRDGLYAEEVSRDAEAAAKHYGEVLERYAGQRQFAATAIFRLAEVRRKQGRKDEAIALYQRLITEFPDLKDQVGPAKESLAALGGKIPQQGAATDDEESRELARIRNLEKTSPDIAASGSLLVAATKADQFRVVTYLLGRGANPNVMGEGETGPTTPLGMAASNGNLAMAEVLIKAGASVQGSGNLTPMFLAIDTCRPKIIELLIQSGLDVNKLLPRGGTPLLMAIRRGYQPTVDLLLDSGADVNAVVPEESVGALHMTVFFENAKLVERLLRMGANPSLAAKVKWKSSSMPYSQASFQVQPGDTPLMVASGRNNTRMMELLLSKTGKPDFAPLLSRAIEENARDAAAWLLEKGGDPNGAGVQGIPLLIRAIRQWDPELIKLLLDRGADPNVVYNGRMVPANIPESQVQGYPVAFYSALRIAAGANTSESRKNAPKAEIFRLLVEAGAKPDEEWLKGLLAEDGFSGVPRGSTHEVRRMMAERFIIPALAGRPAVTAMIGPFYDKPVLLQAQHGGAPLDLARLLLMPESALKLPVTEPSHNGRPPTRVSIRRKGGDGKLTEVWTGSLDQKEAFPDLLWGDVVELSYKDPVSDGTNIAFRDEFPDDLKWALQKKISFPVTIEVDGETVAYQMRGDRIAFDATKKELPWIQFSKLSRIFIRAPLMLETAIVRREGWPDIQLGHGAMGKFHLQPGDSLRFVTKLPGDFDALKNRRSSVRIESPGLPASRIHWLENGDTPLPAPTLMEAMADLLSSRNAVPIATPPEEILGRTNRIYSFDAPETLWTHPDFSKLRIRRLKTDGNEEIIHVDLAAVMASCAGSGSAGDIRRKDIPLHGGDVVEVPLRGDTGGHWKGLTPAEAACLASVLNCRVQFLDKSGRVELRELRYDALAFPETEAGRYPFYQPEAQETVSTTRVFDVLWAEQTGVEKLVRGGITYYGDHAGRMFFRDGDQVTRVQLQFSPPAAPAAPVSPAGSITPKNDGKTSDPKPR